MFVLPLSFSKRFEAHYQDGVNAILPRTMFVESTGW